MSDSEGDDDDVVHVVSEALPGAPATAATAAKKKKKKKKKPAAAVALSEADMKDLYARAMANGEQDVPVDKRLSTPMIYGGFKFTGALRPAYVTRQMQVPEHIERPDHWKTGQPDGEIAEGRGAPIHVYTPEEIERLRKACRIGREVLDIARAFLRPGVTGDELDRVVFQACVDRNAYPSPLNYWHFPKSFCVSANEVICHGIPDCRPIADGDIVNLDISVFVHGMHSDLNETFLVGNVDAEGTHLVKTAFLALQAAQRMIKPGTFYRDLGNEISKVAGAGGCAVVKKYCGHGVGRLLCVSSSSFSSARQHRGKSD